MTLTLGSAVSAGEAVTVGHSPPAQGPRLRRIGGGAEAAAFSGQAVTNDTAATTTPTVVGSGGKVTVQPDRE